MQIFNFCIASITVVFLLVLAVFAIVTLFHFLRIVFQIIAVALFILITAFMKVTRA